MWDIPTLEIKTAKGNRRELDLNALYESLRGYAEMDAFVVLEELHASPLQRPGAPIAPGAIATSNFRLGESRGVLRMALVALGMRHERVTPQAWKKRMLEGRTKGKGESLERARELFPACAKELRAKAHNGRAEALLIAEFGRRTL